MGARITVDWETRGQLSVHIPQKVFLLESKPKIVVIIVDRGSTIRNMRRTVSIEDLGHHEKGILAARIREDRHRLQQTV